MSNLQFAWGHDRRFNDYPSYIRKEFGQRVQKISVNVGFTCPNRDGTKGIGGCIYCNNDTFSPNYCDPEKSVTSQIKKGKTFFQDKYPDMIYLAYFQSYTNTYSDLAQLRRLYSEALSQPGIVGLVIGTRPDCVNQEIIDLLLDVSQGKYLMIEFGLESTLNRTLERINRCHSWEESLQAIALCNKNNVQAGGHIILGLPGENHNDFMHHAQELSKLDLKTLKLHQLQITKNTIIANEYSVHPSAFNLFTMEEYLETVVDFIEHLTPKIVLERFASSSPYEKLIAPQWNKTKNFEIVAKVDTLLEQRNTWQGKLYTSTAL